MLGIIISFVFGVAFMSIGSYLIGRGGMKGVIERALLMIIGLILLIITLKAMADRPNGLPYMDIKPGSMKTGVLLTTKSMERPVIFISGDKWYALSPEQIHSPVPDSLIGREVIIFRLYEKGEKIKIAPK